MKIPREYYKSNTIYRSITPDPFNGIVACGFIHHPNTVCSNNNEIFNHYGAFYLLDGHGIYEDETGIRQELHPGCYVQRLPGRRHSTYVTSSGNWLEFFVCFGADTYENLVGLNLLSKNPVTYPGPSSTFFNRSIQLLTIAKEWPDDNLPYLYLKLQEYAIDLHQRFLRGRIDPGIQLQMQRASDLLSVSHDFMPAKEVAEMLGMSYENFRKKFKQYYNQPPTAYQLIARINHSKSLLKDTNKTLNEIALCCHFSDAFAYSKAFKKYYGISPSQFRGM